MICKEVNTVMRLQRTAKFGIILMACSAIGAFLWWYSLGYLFLMWSWFHYSMALYESTKHGPPWDKPLGYILAENSPYFVLFALWLLSGVILLADALFMKTQT